MYNALYAVIDILASEYGWSKHDILHDTYLDEAYRLQELIQIRKNEEYYMLLAIEKVDGKENITKLKKALEDGMKKKEAVSRKPTLDKESFLKFKHSIISGGGFTIK